MPEALLQVNEIFYSLQGEGVQTGVPALFVRLAGCNLRCPYCDTQFNSAQPYSLTQLRNALADYPARHIIWTGGEPALQLTQDIIDFFKAAGYRQSIETNGTRPLPRGIDWITVSPKPEALPHLRENFPQGVQEIRWPQEANGPLPPPFEALPKAQYYCISPINPPGSTTYPHPQALYKCLQFVQAHPQWRLSLQVHKLIGIR